MMDIKKKLIELLAPTSLNFEEAEYLADYLVKNGVTVQDFGLVNDMNNGEHCNFEHNHGAICGSTNLPCIKCNPGGCNNRKEGADG